MLIDKTERANEGESQDGRHGSQWAEVQGVRSFSFTLIMDNPETMTFLTLLPELQLECAMLLDGFTLVRLTCTCTQLRALLDSQHVRHVRHDPVTPCRTHGGGSTVSGTSI